MNDPAIVSIGTAVPPHALSQELSAGFAAERCAGDERQSRVVRRLYASTTIHQRRSVLLAEPRDGRPLEADSLNHFFPPRVNGSRGPSTSHRMAAFERFAPPLAAEACTKALRDAAMEGRQITHLITITCTGFIAPGVEHELIRLLDLPAGVARTQIGFMGCHAALNGLRVAESICRAQSDARVLLCSVELCSLHFQYGWDQRCLVSNALFADGSAAAVIAAVEASGRPCVAGSASRIIGGTAADMGWAIGDHGFEMSLSARVPQVLGANLRPWIDKWLELHGLDVENVRGWAIHAGGPRIVATVADRLGCNGRDVRISNEILSEYGNMSSATLLFILNRMVEQGIASPYVLLGFGPGLSAETVLLRA